MYPIWIKIIFQYWLFYGQLYLFCPLFIKQRWFLFQFDFQKRPLCVNVCLCMCVLVCICVLMGESTYNAGAYTFTWLHTYVCKDRSRFSAFLNDSSFYFIFFKYFINHWDTVTIFLIIITPFLSLIFHRFTSTSIPLNFMYMSFFYYPSTPICAAHILLGVRQSTGAWLTHQEPHPKGKQTLLPEVINCLYCLKSKLMIPFTLYARMFTGMFIVCLSYTGIQAASMSGIALSCSQHTFPSSSLNSHS